MAIERKKVTKHYDPHPAEALSSPEPAESSSAFAPPDLPTPPRVSASGLVSSVGQASASDEPAPEPKVPSSFRLPRTLLDRLDAGAIAIPAALGRRVSKNQLVENAIDEYLTRYGL
ncbi:hypothetical protein GCM10009551_054330 [Nocardiopsis tropica]|uniref:hypothetical protein n=1 Tax=Tsukamurella strandjordii TaxID=147577 RepID=UPI0031DF2F9C